MKPRACHTGMKQGARVLAILRDGRRLTGRFMGQSARHIEIEGHGRIAKGDLRTLGYLKEASRQ